MTISGATTPGSNEPGSDGNEGVLRIAPPKLQHYWSLPIRLFNVWFGLVSLFNGISTLFRLFNAKAILLEEQ